ncbi:NYN domain-containing protein [Homoserinimonas sp. A447]
MPESSEGRVAVYIDFDNIVISRYDQKHGRSRGRARPDNLKDITAASLLADPELAQRLTEATIDIGAVLDFASSFGSIAVSRAYADWSVEVNASYKNQLMDRAVELVQLFPAVRPAKNGADIRLAVDIVEDLFRLDHLTHVVIVAGDSDYIALAQRCKRLGRYVVGIGVAGATSKFLASACDEFADYDALPGVTTDEETQNPPEPTEEVAEPKKAKTKGSITEPTFSSAAGSPTRKQDKQKMQLDATALLVRALRLGQAKDDADWLGSSSVKNQMLRMDPSFQESALGYKTFTDFIKSRKNEVELQEDGQMRRIRLRPSEKATKQG